MNPIVVDRWEVPVRVVTGAFILNSGLQKRRMPPEAAQGVHQFAQNAELPPIEKMQATTFTNVLAAAEIGLGAALLAPFVPREVAGMGLTAFSLGLLRLYWKTPGMRQEGDVRPTEQGQGLAKDAWMLGIGLTLLVASEGPRRSKGSAITRAFKRR